MEIIEKQLLESVFDALNRLFDKKCEVIDVYAIMFSSNIALQHSIFSNQLTIYTKKLERIFNSSESNELQRNKALESTNKLRNELNGLLPV